MLLELIYFQENLQSQSIVNSSLKHPIFQSSGGYIKIRIFPLHENISTATPYPEYSDPNTGSACFAI